MKKKIKERESCPSVLKEEILSASPTTFKVKEMIHSLSEKQCSVADIESMVVKLLAPVAAGLNTYFKLFHTQLEKMDEKMQEYADNLDKTIRDGLKSYHFTTKQFEKTLERFEESLMYLMHNIKKNQFLYAHYPDEWVQNYQDIKQGVKKENAYMDKLIKEKQ